MNTSIGIRVKPDSIIYSIINKTEDEITIEIVDKLNVPKVLEAPEQLKFIRNTFLDIIFENQVNKACIRVTENIAMKPSLERINIEAVIQELIASSTIEKYYVGKIANISSHLGFHRDMFKSYLEKVEYTGIKDWSKYNKEQKESLLAALSALNL